MRKTQEILENLVSNGFMLYEGNPRGFMGRFISGRFKGMTLVCSWDRGWEHASIDGKTRTLKWEEMCFLKDLLWDEEEAVVQFHPKKSEYVNLAPYCLHLWKPIEKYYGELISPPRELVY